MTVRLEILPQPTDSTCGPTCLQAVYGFWGDDRPLQQVIDEVEVVETGGTLAVWLACHALRNGYRATIYSYNVTVFDPSWWDGGVDVAEKLRAQLLAKPSARLQTASAAYIEFLTLGGRVLHEELTPALLEKLMARGHPVLTGLSATYLYQCPREMEDGRSDDVAGAPVGHFVVLAGYQAEPPAVLVADPLHDNPRFGSAYYWVDAPRLIAAILLGIVTYDANLLVIEPR